MMKALFAVVLFVGMVPVSSVRASCAPEDLCEPPAPRRYPSLARSIGITVEREWIEANVESLHESFQPGCNAFAGCLSTWGNPVSFCRVLLTMDLRAICEERWDIDENFLDWQQCRAVADVYSIAQTRPAERAWPAIQQCAAEAAAGKPIARPLVRVEPAAPRPGEDYEFVVKAFDPESGIPVHGLITVDGSRVGPVFEKFRFGFRFDRVVDELGRVSFRLPRVVLHASPARGSGFPGFPDTPVPLATAIPATRLTFDPPPDEWTVGENVVRVTARDPESGDEVVGTFMKRGVLVGPGDEPVSITLERRDVLCGEPVWFRPSGSDRPDESFPISICR
jgi:hypothetical protein